MRKRNRRNNKYDRRTLILNLTPKSREKITRRMKRRVENFKRAMRIK